MVRFESRTLFALITLVAVCGFCGGALAAAPAGEAAAFPPPLSSYGDDASTSVLEQLAGRIRKEPFNLIATLMFLAAIVHTLMAGKILHMAEHFEEKHRKKLAQRGNPRIRGREPVSFRATILHFLGEVEAVFGIWLVPLFFVLALSRGWSTVTGYVDHLNFAEPIFVVVIMAMAATRPVIRFAENCTSVLAKAFGGSVMAWWFCILTLIPVLGSFITEPAAMTIAAMLMGQKVFALNPSNRFKYATLGALFVAVSVGGTFTHFAAPPVLMVAERWNLDIATMFLHFGSKSFAAILTINIIIGLVFRGEMAALQQKAQEQKSRHEKRGAEHEDDENPPVWITLVHLGFLAWTVLNLHHPAFVIGGFLVFIAFTIATEHHQFQLKLKSPILVGLFLAGLVAHGGFQGWWIAPILGRLAELPLFLGATILTAFNDNAAITYLASLVPQFNPQAAADPELARKLQYAVLTGAVTGGGLTVIANAPNPAGQSILNRYFSGGISPAGLFLGALFPTIVAALYFMLIRSY